MSLRSVGYSSRYCTYVCVTFDYACYPDLACEKKKEKKNENRLKPSRRTVMRSNQMTFLGFPFPFFVYSGKVSRVDPPPTIPLDRSFNIATDASPDLTPTTVCILLSPPIANWRLFCFGDCYRYFCPMYQICGECRYGFSARLSSRNVILGKMCTFTLSYSAYRERSIFWIIVKVGWFPVYILLAHKGWS